MLVEGQIFNIKWSKRNKEWYEQRGYNFTKYSDTFNVKAEDLSKGNHCCVEVECDFCGKIIDVVWKDYFKYKNKNDKYACQNCRQTKTSINTLSYRRDNLYNRAKEFCDSKSYILLTTKEDIFTWNDHVEYKCPIHGIHQTTIGLLVLQKGCPKCAIENNSKLKFLSVDFIEQEILKYGGVLLNKDEYSGWADKNLKVVCPDCGKIFITSYNSFVKHKGQRCPKCTNVESTGEKAIRLFLENNNILYMSQYRFDDCKNKNTLPFDFYLPELNMAVEYDGEGHYIPIRRGKNTHDDAKNELLLIKKRDDIKTKYCLKNNIYLLRIPYWEYENIEKILNTEIARRYSLVS